jgi:malate synthase
MAKQYAQFGKLSVHPAIYSLVSDQIAPAISVAPEVLFSALEKLISEFAPENRALLAERDALQKQIDGYFASRKGQPFDEKNFAAFLAQINYIVPEGADFKVMTKNVDAELASINGPQLVVPVSNARFALNAANARWGSLYDALYGAKGNINILPDDDDFSVKGYNPKRGQKVIAWANDWLDKTVGLAEGSFSQVTGFVVEGDKLKATLESGKIVGLRDPALFAGARKKDGALSEILLKHHGLHIALVIDRAGMIGKTQKSGLEDIRLEAAVTTIQDLEDSVSAVDGDDKALAYANWHGIMNGTLSASFDKGGKKELRRLEADREYISPKGEIITLPGRSCMFVRHVGMQMMTDAVKYEGKEIPETYLDLLLTVASAMQDLKKDAKNPYRNSRTGSIYIVKPKMHGPKEVNYNVRLFARAEELLGLPKNTLKIGIMDEEQRTSLNLKECIREASERVVFINTGFLDRTGDFIHTCMEAGPVASKAELNAADWLKAYEWNNTLVGLALDVHKHGQIGKGMWAQNINMKGLLDTKKAHLDMGASTAWVPSPTGATIHALHYHEADAGAKQRELATRPRPEKSEIVKFPMLKPGTDVASALESYAQSILGYVVRWVDMGVGCSSVPDINDVRLMEDRATLRIHSQILANWLHHAVIDRAQLEGAFCKVSGKIDGQNQGEAGYIPLAGNEGGPAFRCAMELVTEGTRSPNGYVDDILKKYRLEAKAAQPAVMCSAPSAGGRAAR